MTMPNGNEPKPETPPAGPEGQPPAAGQPTGQEPVTQEQLKAFAEELKGSFESAYRGVQSQNDRAVSKMQTIQQEISQQLQGFPGATPEQIEEFSRNKAIESLFEGQAPPAEPGTVPGQEPPAAGAQTPDGQPQAPEPTHWADAVVDNLVKKIGFDIEEADAEYAELQKVITSEDPMEFIDGYRQAISAKAERLGKQAPARIPAMVSGQPVQPNAISDVTDPTELYELAKKAGRI